jgi:hypothetical protein
MFLNFCTKRLFFRFEAIFAYQDVYTWKYNYDYNKAVF